MRILVSGGCGFIGSHVVDRLLERNHKVLVLDNFSTGKLDNMSGFSFDHRDLSIHNCDITHLPEVLGASIAFNPDAIIHLAAQAAITTAIENPVLDVTVNAIGTLNMLHAAKKSNAKRFVFSSTSAVYGKTKKRLREESLLNPVDPYGISKLAAEMYIKALCDDYVILRYGNVYGPRQKPIGENQVVARMMSHLLKGDDFQIHGDGMQKRDYVFVKDVADATISALRGKKGIYNIASGESFSVNEIAKFVEQAFSLPSYKWEHTAQQDLRRNVQMAIKNAGIGLRWYPSTKIVEGIQETVYWWENG